MKLAPQSENARHRQATCVADTEPPVGHSQGVCCLCGTPDELDLGSSPWRTVDHHISERDARTEAGSKCFEYGLLCGEPPRQSLDSIRAVTDFLQFALREATRNQRIAWIFDPALQFSNLNEVDSVPDYIHVCQRAPDKAIRQHNFPTL